MLDLGSRKLTDEEFIERIRRQSRSSRKAGIILSALFAACFVAWIALGVSLKDMIQSLLNEPHAFDRGFNIGIALGAAFGLILFCIACKLVNSLMMVSGLRIHRMLLKYYDLASVSERKA